MQRTSDGIVTKRLMSPGSGSRPPEHSIMIDRVIIGSIVRVAYKPLDAFNTAAPLQEVPGQELLPAKQRRQCLH